MLINSFSFLVISTVGILYCILQRDFGFVTYVTKLYN